MRARSNDERPANLVAGFEGGQDRSDEALGLQAAHTVVLDLESDTPYQLVHVIPRPRDRQDTDGSASWMQCTLASTKKSRQLSLGGFAYGGTRRVRRRG
jgi:hypothetical protein